MIPADQIAEILQILQNRVSPMQEEVPFLGPVAPAAPGPARFGPFLGGYEGARLPSDRVPGLVNTRTGKGASQKQITHRARFANQIQSGAIPKKESFYAWMTLKADPRNSLDLRKPGNKGFYICKLAKTLLSNNKNRKRYWPIFARMLYARMNSEKHIKAGHLNIGRKDVTRALKIYDKMRSPASESCVKIPGGKEGKNEIKAMMAAAGEPLPKPRKITSEQKKKMKKGRKKQKQAQFGPFQSGYRGLSNPRGMPDLL